MKNMSKNKNLYIIIAMSLALLLIIIYPKAPNEKNELDDFAACLKDSGAKFYGTENCSYCKAQRELFGPSFPLVPYVACDGAVGMSPVCKSAGITAYPTWIFSDGSKDMGMKSLQYLAKKTGCTLPN